MLITPTGVLAVAAALRGAEPADAYDGANARRRRLFINLGLLVPLAVFAVFSLRHEVKLDWTGAPWAAALPLMAAGMIASGTTSNGFRAWIRRAWMPTLVTMLLIYGAGLHYLALGLPGAGYSRHIELVPVGWRDLSRRVLQTAATIREKPALPRSSSEWIVTPSPANWRSMAQSAHNRPSKPRARICSEESVSCMNDGRHPCQRRAELYCWWRGP